MPEVSVGNLKNTEGIELVGVRNINEAANVI